MTSRSLVLALGSLSLVACAQKASTESGDDATTGSGVITTTTTGAGTGSGGATSSSVAGPSSSTSTSTTSDTTTTGPATGSGTPSSTTTSTSSGMNPLCNGQPITGAPDEQWAWADFPDAHCG